MKMHGPKNKILFYILNFASIIKYFILYIEFIGSCLVCLGLKTPLVWMDIEADLDTTTNILSRNQTPSIQPVAYTELTRLQLSRRWLDFVLHLFVPSFQLQIFRFVLTSQYHIFVLTSQYHKFVLTSQYHISTCIHQEQLKLFWKTQHQSL